MVPDDSDGNRTRVTAVKGRCLNRLTTEPYLHLKIGSIILLPGAPQVGLEPTTPRLTAECSTAELLRIIYMKMTFITYYM